jgi:hypothetical protein
VRRGCSVLDVGGQGFWCGMLRGLKRYYGQGQLNFLTFSCYRRLALPLRLATFGVVLVDEKSGSWAAALQIAASQYYAGLSGNSAARESIRRGAGKNW